MPLDDIGFKNNLKNAFQQTTWDLCAIQITDAIDIYLKTGTVATIVTGIIAVIPTGSSPYIGTGTGIINNTQKITLKNTIRAAFQQETWDLCAQTIANAIDSFLQSAKADMTDIPINVNNTNTTIVTTAGLVDLSPDLKSAFKNSGSWKDRDAWVTSTGYIVNDNILNGSQQYKCLIAHKSGTFAIDLSNGKWQAVDNDSMMELLKTAIKKFIKACVINTVDSGITLSPPGHMTGTGTGGIT